MEKQHKESKTVMQQAITNETDPYNYKTVKMTEDTTLQC